MMRCLCFLQKSAEIMVKECSHYGYRSLYLICFLFGICLTSCLGTHGITEISDHPYRLLYEDDSTAKFGVQDDDVSIEVRRVASPRPIENLAINYGALFPEGEVIRPGDTEEYVKIDGRNAYKVLFRPKYIRKRKRVDDKPGAKKEEPPEGWTEVTINDPLTGRPETVLQGPVIRRERILYLVAGDQYVYYILMRADGDAIEPARKRLEKLVSEDLKYR
jgi:hypothetical protein